MLSTHYTPGALCWLDLGTPDVPATVAHYEGLFGWTYQQAGDYGFFQSRGRTVAGLGLLTEPGARPAWMPYFQTTDAEATVKSVEQAGGTARTPVMAAADVARLAQLTDPAGAEFAIWEPGTTRGLDLVNDPGSLGWAELYTPDIQAARAFYQSVFAWRVEEMPMGDQLYPVISPAEGDDAAMAGIVVDAGSRPHWLPYFEVADCDEVIARSQASGGSVLVPVAEVDAIGRFATLTDPHGAHFAIITSTL
ncbi:VOC family protein [Nonomuraea sp. NPDC050556]|uniref:VOC family protein n=1 Tax=Nonomuraea sp. NPDC050556 TaxID=3364369 RepID=UPI00378B6B60